MKGLRKILWVSWTAKKTNEWVLNRTGVKRELLDTVKARKLAYYGHTMRKQRSCLEKEIMQGTLSGARRRGRPRTAWMDNIKTWTGLCVEESIIMTEINGESTSMVWPTLGSRTAKEQNRKGQHQLSCSRCDYTRMRGCSHCQSVPLHLLVVWSIIAFVEMILPYLHHNKWSENSDKRQHRRGCLSSQQTHRQTHRRDRKHYPHPGCHTGPFCVT